ncbi:hypothetical protein [Chitinophaga polysaccharea]|uniref:hypothetical protein n=1 Tax=Chitinophaga polysaccharea TaxID=1293035 RepID=UPI0011597BAD|nr:hypothetical protein [Chitinophaga polysaccharea]
MDTWSRRRVIAGRFSQHCWLEGLNLPGWGRFAMGGELLYAYLALAAFLPGKWRGGGLDPEILYRREKAGLMAGFDIFNPDQ